MSIPMIAGLRTGSLEPFGLDAASSGVRHGESAVEQVTLEPATITLKARYSYSCPEPTIGLGQFSIGFE